MTTDPIAYTIAYSFSGYQALNPSNPLPAAPMDVEFAGIEASVTSLITALAEVRRSDGNLQNASVSWDGLDADLKARITGTDTRVTVADLNPTAFAVQSEAEAGVSGDKIMTPEGTKQQLDALRALASQAQAQVGTNNTTVMTPLRGVEQLNALRAFASQAEAQVGTNNTKVVTPLRVAEALAALRPTSTATASLTWGAVAATASAQQSVTVTGAVVGDRVILGLPAAFDAGLVAQAFVVSADTVRVRLTNVTGSPITPLAGVATDFAVTALRF